MVYGEVLATSSKAICAAIAKIAGPESQKCVMSTGPDIVWWLSLRAALRESLFCGICIRA